MYKKVLVIIGLIGLISWGVYDYYFSSKVTKSSQENVQNVSNKSENLGIAEGNKALNFELSTLDGKKVKLSDMIGKKVILNLWATWCPPCKAEMPHMQEFYRSQKGKNVEILAVNLTTAEKDASNIKPFVKNYGLTFPVLLDNEGTVGDAYQAITIPTSYIIDSKGIIRKRIVGPMDKEMMTELMNSID